MAAVAGAGASAGRQRVGRQFAWLAGVVAIVGLIGSYLFLAVLSHPLVPGSAEGLNGGVRQQDPSSSPGDDKQIRLFDYVDGKTVTMFMWLANDGKVP